MIHIIVWSVSMFGGFISEKFNKFNLLILLPFIYIIQIILPVHLISGAKYHYVNSHLEEFATQEEITKYEQDIINKNNINNINNIDDDNEELCNFEIKYDKSIPTDIPLSRRSLIYNKTWKEVFNIIDLFNPFTYLKNNNNNYGITEESLNKLKNINKLKKRKFKSWQNPVSPQGMIIVCFIINILVMKYYWKKTCLKF